MHKLRRRRLTFVITLLVVLGIVVGLALFALRRDISLYLTPTQLQQQQQLKRLKGRYRIGGMVVKGSVQRNRKTLQVTFRLTDYHHQETVTYTGVLPSLFREGQGIVAEGHINAKGVFVADQVLAKHDNLYRPPGIGRLPARGTLVMPRRRA